MCVCLHTSAYTFMHTQVKHGAMKGKMWEEKMLKVLGKIMEYVWHELAGVWRITEFSLRKLGICPCSNDYLVNTNWIWCSFYVLCRHRRNGNWVWLVYIVWNSKIINKTLWWGKEIWKDHGDEPQRLIKTPTSASQPMGQGAFGGSVTISQGMSETIKNTDLQ